MNKTALITGAAGGVGRAVAARLAADGWQLIVASRNGERLSAAFGEQHLHVAADCTTAAGARQILQAAKDHELLPTALAHCVGNIRLGALHRMSETDFNDCLNANLVSAFHTLSAFVGALREARSAGAAVLVSSAAARIGTPNHEAVAAAKAGLEGLVRGAAATYAPKAFASMPWHPASWKRLAPLASSPALPPVTPPPGNIPCPASAQRMNWPT
jgi:NAD(P)-dependent dehydrogenase (short-subunit alcohol dehydrogenase family)